MNVVMIGTSFERATLEERERFSLSSKQMQAASDRVKESQKYQWVHIALDL